MVTYRFFALRLRCNCPIPGLPRAADAGAVDIEIWLQSQSWPTTAFGASRAVWYPSASRTAADPVVTVWKLADGGFFEMCYDDGTEFLLDEAGARIWCTWPDSLTLEDACTYLLGPVLGFALRLRGITCLHASGIEVERQAVAFVGPGGAGKSTAAAVFAESGFAILSDDVVALSDRGSAILAQPAVPRLGLWPDSVEAVFGSPELLPRQTPNWDKRYLDLTQGRYRFQEEPLPLKAIYVIGSRDAAARAPFVDRLRPSVGLTRLIQNTYVNYLLDRTMRAHDFDVLARLVSHVPVRDVVPHADVAQLPRLRDVILDDLQDLNN